MSKNSPIFNQIKIKDIKKFRQDYKVKVKKRDDGDMSFTDPDFVGVYHEDEDSNKRINGYFELTHGDKKIHKFLPSILKIAEDGQAIYEFIQNAVDCNSSKFYIFYNDKYFLAINNGNPFKEKDVLSILNIADTTKDSCCDDIGRFGIGFKLVHRLVGKDEGIKELVEDYKGPTIFSWDNVEQLRNLLEFSKDNNHKTLVDNNSSMPWLFKILATNFPIAPSEVVRDINYEKKELFPYIELMEIVEYLNENLNTHETIDVDNLQQGSLFFLKLGEGKKKLLDSDYQGLQNGVQYSMNFLKNLNEVFINDMTLTKNELKIKQFSINKNSEVFESIGPDYKNCDIKISLGYTDYKDAEKIRRSPSFYKYFPMGDETNGFSFIVHCDSFDIEANRRKLHDSHKNRKLFQAISNFITQYADELKEEDFEGYLNLYANLLISKIPNKDNNKWLNSIFFDNILKYIKSNIPLKNGFSNDSKNVKVKDINDDLNIDLKMLGLGDIQWFYWDKLEDDKLIDEASEKLNLEEWNIFKIILKADIEGLNNWIKQLSERDYSIFLNEIDKELSESCSTKFITMKLFRLSDGNFYSIEEIRELDNCILITKKTINIKQELEILGFNVSDLDVSSYKFYNSISKDLEDDEKIFKKISSKTKISNDLTPSHKINIFKNFVNKDTKFNDVGDESLKQLYLFTNNKNEIKPLSELLSTKLKIPSWIESFVISIEEYNTILDKYLLSEDEIYNDIIYENWDLITGIVTSHDTFYQEVKKYYTLKEKNQSLDDKDFILIKNSEGEYDFVNKEYIFFSKELIKVNNYKNLQNAIYSLTNIYTPVEQTLKYMGSAPFIIESQNISELDSDRTVLDIDDIKELIQFFDKNSEKFFENYFVEKIEDRFYIANIKYKHYQYYTNKQEHIDFIIENIKDTLHLLPSELKEFKDQVIHGEKLQDTILNNLEQLDEHIETLIDILNNEKFIEAVDKIDEISFRDKENYTNDDFEFKLLDILNPEQLEKLKDNIIIVLENRSFKLNDITSSENISFDEEKYKIKLSEILPNTQIFENTDYLTKIYKKLKKCGIPENKLDILFKTAEEFTDKQYKYFYDQLLEATDSSLENASQLAYIMLYNNYIECINIEEIVVGCIDGKEHCLDDAYYIENYSFIYDCNTLDSKYAELRKLLKLNEKNSIFKIENSEFQVLLKPYFNSEEEKFIVPNIGQNLQEHESIDLMNHIYTFWSASKPNKRIIQNINWASIEDIETDTIIGINPYEKILEDKYAIESEVCPKWLKQWVKKDEDSLEFIFDFGIHTRKSQIFHIREYLLSGSSLLDIKFDDLNNTMLQNTMTWIQDKNIKFDDKDEKFDLLSKIVEKIDDEFDIEIDKKTLEKDSINFDEHIPTNYYKEWSDKCNIEIFFYKGKIPFIVSYNNYILKTQAKEDIAKFDNIIYLNSEKFKVKEDILLMNPEEKYLSNELFIELVKKLLGNKDEKIDEEATSSMLSSDKEGLSKDEQQKIAEENKEMVKEFLKTKGFDISNWQENCVHITGVKDPNDNDVELLIKGAKGGKLYISPVEWLVLTKSNAKLIAINSENNIVNITFKELMKPGNTFHLEFSTSTFSEDDMKKISDIFHYKKDCKFIIESPGFSYFNFMEDFSFKKNQSGTPSASSENDF